ncbi:unnamed protein product [Paramecium sonneborni]|uniref:Uncharacterized protein n=1 Tax=Paramecium sonneborni TaxID=65129 RepID=A0A8S1MWL6_9CILI|nr:unnamed protein product [Paramecium sonneborni]
MQIQCTQADHQNQQIIGICIGSNCQYQRPYCHDCLHNHVQHFNKLISLEHLNEWIQKRVAVINDLQKNAQECKSVLDSLINIFIPYFNINLEQSGISEIDNIIKGLCKVEVFESQFFNHLNQLIQEIKQIIEEILKQSKSQTDQQQVIKVQAQQPQIMQSLIQEQNNQVNILKPNLKPFTFELIKQNTIQQDEYCYAIAFNKDSSIVVAGCKEKINVYQHKEGKLDQIQVLCEHQDNVFTLNFMRNTNDFVSGSLDKLIIIWQMNGNNQWNCQLKLNGHSNSIFCLLLNNNDDLIVSGSSDKQIKFWIKQNQWLCQQTITDHTREVYSLSLNDQQNKVISCSKDCQIFVIEQSQLDKKWSVIQKIKVEKFGYRLCFINDNQFTFQPLFGEQMQIYEIDCNTKQYRKTKEIIVKCGSISENNLFPQQYLKSKCLLVNKNGKHVNLMRKKENGEFIFDQSIQFGVSGLYGQLSQDGEYLITWDCSSNEIQIRKSRAG